MDFYGFFQHSEKNLFLAEIFLKNEIKKKNFFESLKILKLKRTGPLWISMDFYGFL